MGTHSARVTARRVGKRTIIDVVSGLEGYEDIPNKQAGVLSKFILIRNNYSYYVLSSVLLFFPYKV